MLIEGFNIVKSRLKVLSTLDISKSPGGINPINVDGRFWLDDLIERRMGGNRSGLRVKWTLKDGTFYYDPYLKTLTKDGK